MMQMYKTQTVRRAGVVLMVMLVYLSTTAHGQVGGGYNLDWWTIDAGAGVAAGAGYTLTGIAGQPEAAPAASGGGYTLSHGFLHPSPGPLARVGAWSLY